MFSRTDVRKRLPVSFILCCQVTARSLEIALSIAASHILAHLNGHIMPPRQALQCYRSATAFHAAGDSASSQSERRCLPLLTKEGYIVAAGVSACRFASASRAKRWGSTLMWFRLSLKVCCLCWSQAWLRRIWVRLYIVLCVFVEA